MKCKQIEKKLIFYIEHELDATESTLIKAHLEECTACKQLCSQIEQCLEIVGEEKLTETNPFFFTRVAERISQETVKKSIFSWIPKRQFVLQAAMYVVVVCCAILIGRFLGSDTMSREQVQLNNFSDTAEYQLFASSNDFQFAKNAYFVETTTNE